MPNPSPILFGTVTGSSASAGNCVIYNGTSWVLYTPTNAGSLTGCQIGVLLGAVTAGSQAPIQIAGSVDPQIFNLGPGGAGNVIPGLTPARQLGSNVTPIGSCDANGVLTILQGYVGVAIGSEGSTSTEGVILATSFGAKGDTQLIGGQPVGTDDTAALQAMLDSVTLSSQPNVCKLNATSFKYNNSGLAAARTCYRITQPLVVNDNFSNFTGNSAKIFVGEPGAQSGLYHQDFLGPAVVGGNAGFNSPVYVTDPNGSGETLCMIGPVSNGPSTTIASGSNGQVVPGTGNVINVGATSGFPTAGAFTVDGALIGYTGVTSTTFTGCFVLNNFGEGNPTMHTGDAVALPAPLPQWCLSDYDIGDLSGFTAFTIEFFINPCSSTAWLSGLPGFIGSLFGCGGTRSGQSHTTFTFAQTNEFTAPNTLEFTLTTANGTFTVTTSQSLDHGWTANTLNHVEIDYDGAHLYMFVNGQQGPANVDSGIMTAVATGALVQKSYESLTIASGQNVAWPVLGGAGSNQAGPAMLLGRVRFSNVARHTASFTAPLPSAVTCDAHTRFYMDFTSASVPTRASLQGFNIAQSGQGRFGQILPSGKGYPVWINNHANGLPYTRDLRIHDMFFVGPGTGIYLSAATDATVGENCFFLLQEQGIFIDNYSYNSGVGKNATFWEIGDATTTHNYLCSNIVIGRGVQFAYIEDGHSSSSVANWHVIHVNADLKIGTGFPAGFNEGVYASVQGAGSVFMNGASILDDQSVGYSVAGCLYAPQAQAGQSTLSWTGGFIGMANTHAAPIFLIGAANVQVTVNTSIFASSSTAIFSFQGAGPNGGSVTTVPAMFLGSNASATPYIDASNPGPVSVPQRENFGAKTLTPSANAGLVVGASGYASPSLDDAFYKEYQIATGGWTGNQSVTWPSNPGKVYIGKNNNAHSAILTSVSGATTQTISSGSTFKVQDVAGTGLVSLL